MEALLPGRPRDRSRPHGWTHHQPRLPTPDETCDSDSQEEKPRTPRVARFLQPLPGERGMRSDYAAGGPMSRVDNSKSFAPHSPPYQSSDGQKPSLPPLKTVLGDNITSPPRTPNLHGMQQQPSPREPTYTTGTYKPPSLYPSKKLRPDFVLEPVPPFSSLNRHSPPGMPSAVSFESNQDAASDPSETHRRPSHHPSNVRRSRTPPGMPYKSALPRRGSTSAKPSPYGTSYYEQKEAARDFARSEMDGGWTRRGSIVPNENAHATRNVFAQVSDLSAPRRPSAFAYDEAQHQCYGHDRDVQFSYPPETRREVAMQPTSIRRDSARHDDLYSSQLSHESARSQYHGAQPPFFMQNHYDYQQGKARKRSNLPKQSTEIMKTWFDQNISNPYPSEEQKAIFSNATGISMTQVSNWFINHRRRCPELRDKRDKTRGREYEL